MEELVEGTEHWSRPVQDERAEPGQLQADRQALSLAPELAVALDGVPSPVIILNLQRQIVAANAAFQEKVGADGLDAILGDRFGEAIKCRNALTTPGGCGSSSECTACGGLHATLQAVKGSKSTHECSISRRVEGEEATMDLRVTATPMAFNDGSFVMFAMVNIDNEKRRQMLERTFFHDIRNTAAIFHGVAEIIQSNGGYMVSGLDAGELLQQASSRFMDEIDSQQQLLAAEHGALAVSVKPVLVGPLLREIGESYSQRIGSRGRRVQLAADSQEFLMDTDKRLLSRVLGNMLKNGIEASRVDEMVTFGARVDGRYGTLWVHNEAVMPRITQLQMFNRSFSTKGPGRGLGTYSMKLLTEQYLGGKIAFRSEPGHGTTFTVTFPLDFNDGTQLRAAGVTAAPSSN